MNHLHRGWKRSGFLQGLVPQMAVGGGMALLAWAPAQASTPNIDDGPPIVILANAALNWRQT